MARFLTWFSYVWSVAAISIVAISHWMYVYEIEVIAGFGPFNVKNHIAVAFLLAPGGITAIVHYYFWNDKTKQ